MVSVDIYYILFGCYGLHIIMQTAKESNEEMLIVENSIK